MNQEGPVTAIPSLRIEILSSNRAHDRITKRFVYGASGVQEFWAIDPAGRIGRFFDANLLQRQEVSDALQSPLLPGFHLSAVSLFI